MQYWLTHRRKHVFLVGGFGASKFLLSEMKKLLPGIARNIKNNSSFQSVSTMITRVPWLIPVFIGAKLFLTAL